MNNLVSPNKLLALGTTILLASTASSFIYKVNPGERAIIFNKFGKGISSQVMTEGYHFKCPVLQEIIKYDIKIQPFDYFSFTATKDMQTVSIKIKIFYRFLKKSHGKIHPQNSFGFKQGLCQ